MKDNSFIMLTITVAGMLACSGNDAKYVITGKNAPRDGVSVYLVDRMAAAPIDSAVVANGTFKMQGNAADVYSVNSIPDNLLINPEGIIVAPGLRGEALAKKLAESFI